MKCFRLLTEPLYIESQIDERLGSFGGKGMSPITIIFPKLKIHSQIDIAELQSESPSLHSHYRLSGRHGFDLLSKWQYLLATINNHLPPLS